MENGGEKCAGPSGVCKTGPKMKLAQKGDDARPGGNNENAPDESWAACAYREVSIKDPGNEQAGVDPRSIGQ